MRGQLFGACSFGQGVRARRWAPIWFGINPRVGAVLAGGAGQHQIGLAATDEFEVNLGQNLAVQERAVLFAFGVINAKAAAQGVELGGRARVLGAGQRDGIKGAGHGQSGAAHAGPLGVEEFHVKAGVVDDEPGIADKGQKIGGAGGK